LENDRQSGEGTGGEQLFVAEKSDEFYNAGRVEGFERSSLERHGHSSALKSRNLQTL